MRGNIKKEHLLLGAVMTAWLVLVQWGFGAIQSDQTARTRDSLASLLRSELAQSNFDYLTRSLMELRKARVLDCVQLELLAPRRMSISSLESPACANSVPSWLLRGEDVLFELSAASGARFRLSYRSLNSVFFDLGLWSSRAGGLLLFALLFYGLQMRARLSLKLAEAERQNAERVFSMAARLAHDIRSPLSALAVVASVLPPEMGKQRTLMQNAVTRINGIAADILSDYRGQTQAAKSSVAFDVLPVIEQILSEKRATAPVGSLQIGFEDKPRRELHVQGDADEFARVISNLVNNSIEASAPSARVSISIAEEGEWVQIRIDDNGQGFSAEALTQLRTSSEGFTSKQGQSSSGYGLGLKGAREFVQHYRGKIHLTNDALLGGARVELSLPRATV